MDPFKFFGSAFINISGSATNISEPVHEYSRYLHLMEDDETFDLEEFLFTSAFEKVMFKINGDSMFEAGIFDGDIAVVEKDMSPNLDDLVIVFLDCRYQIKYLKRDKRNRLYLRSANPEFKNIYVKKSKLQVYGVVSSIIRKFK